MIKKLLSSTSVYSSMRFGFLLVIIACVIILLSIPAYVIILAVKGIQITAWENMGIFVIGVATIITGSGWMKAKQKKIEVENEK